MLSLIHIFIAGFPGETDENHEETMCFINEMEFDRLGVFPYSPEEDTAAAEMENQVPEEIKNARRDEIRELQQEIAFEQAENMAVSYTHLDVYKRQVGNAAVRGMRLWKILLLLMVRMLYNYY